MQIDGWHNGAANHRCARTAAHARLTIETRVCCVNAPRGKVERAAALRSRVTVAAARGGTEREEDRSRWGQRKWRRATPAVQTTRRAPHSRGNDGTPNA